MGKIDEIAAGGSTGAGSIATVPSNRLGGMQSRMSLKDFMVRFYGRVNNRNKFSPVNLEGSIKSINETAAHPYQLDDASSRLKNMQMQGEYDHHKSVDVITYGVEDDEGAFMKITVPIDQGEELERHVAQALADVLDFKKTGHGEDKTLAELLYELKDQFTVINAEFPTIPKDAVYNAGEISEDMPDGNADDESMDDGEDMGDDMDDDSDMDDSEDMDDTEGLEDEDPDDEDIGMDFEDDEDQDEESLLKSVLGMLKSQAEKDIAQAKAEEEKAKAKQAEMALTASKRELEDQEEMVAAQAEMEAQKEKEKKAKEMAELAKYKIKKKRGTNEGFSPIFREAIFEFVGNDTPQSIRRELAGVQQKYRPEPDDTPETKRYKRDQKQLEIRNLRTKLRAAQNKQDYEQQRKDAEQEQNDDQEQQGQQPQQDRSARTPRGPQ